MKQKTGEKSYRFRYSGKGPPPPAITALYSAPNRTRHTYRNKKYRLLVLSVFKRIKHIS